MRKVSVLFAILLLSQVILTDVDIEIEDEAPENNPRDQEPEIKKDSDLPQYAGAKYVTNLTKDNFEQKTKGQSNLQVVFVGADWCPHCKNFKPDYNIMAYDGHYKKYSVQPEFMFYEV